jgi:uncharacterized OB-fold protein
MTSHEVIEHPEMPTPEPGIDPGLEPYWAAANEGRLLFTRCNACQEAIWYPRPICPFCHSADTSWEEAGGRGRVYTFSVVRRGIGAYAKFTYVLAYVQLDEGPRIMTNIVDCDVDSVRIDMPVELVFHRSAAGNALPRFRPAAESV